LVGVGSATFGAARFPRERRSSWRDFPLGLKARGLYGVEFVVADDHAGLRAALREVLAEAAYQRCYVHFLRNALDYVPRRVDDDCLQELRWLYDRRDLPMQVDWAVKGGKDRDPSWALGVSRLKSRTTSGNAER
jgi:transposase-like protein